MRTECAFNLMCWRIPSASGHTSTTPTSAANASGPSGTSKSSVVSGVDLLTGSTAATISPERQQQLAAAAVAAAAANALGNSFLTARSPVQISTSGTGSNPLGQFASQVHFYLIITYSCLCSFFLVLRNPSCFFLSILTPCGRIQQHFNCINFIFQFNLYKSLQEREGRRAFFYSFWGSYIYVLSTRCALRIKWICLRMHRCSLSTLLMHITLSRA